MEEIVVCEGIDGHKCISSFHVSTIQNGRHIYYFKVRSDEDDQHTYELKRFCLDGDDEKDLVSTFTVDRADGLKPISAVFCKGIISNTFSDFTLDDDEFLRGKTVVLFFTGEGKEDDPETYGLNKFEIRNACDFKLQTEMPLKFNVKESLFFLQIEQSDIDELQALQDIPKTIVILYLIDHSYQKNYIFFEATRECDEAHLKIELMDIPFDSNSQE